MDIRKLLSLIFFYATLVTTHAQERQPNPFEEIGKKAKIETLSNGKYEEFFDMDSIQRVGTVLFNIKTHKVVKLLNPEEVYKKASNNTTSSRRYNIDPLWEDNKSVSPYAVFNNNPIRNVDFDGKKPQDIVHTDKRGFITKVEKAEGEDKVVDESGKELKFNDKTFDQNQLQTIIGEKGDDKSYRYTADWNGGDKTRLFTPFSNQGMKDVFNDLGIGKIREDYNFLKKIPFSAGALGAEISLGHGKFDFSSDMANVARDGGNANTAMGMYPPDGTNGFIKFENSNTLYNIYDAGNFMTGKGFNLIGMGLKTMLRGANLNSILTLNGPDTKVDQKALTEGYNYPYIK